MSTFLLVLAGAITITVAAAPVADAAVVRPFAQNYNAAVFGDYILAGNGSSVCPNASAPTDPFGTPKAECATAQARTNTQPAGINDSFFMQWADVDSSAQTFNSSRATITIPTGASVAFARLQWSGDTGTIRLADGTVSAAAGCNTRQFLAGAGTAVLPSGTPESTSVRVNVGANPTVVHAPQVISRDALANVPASQPQFYAAHATVTSTLALAPTGVPVDITVGNVWTPQGFGCYSGWSLTVVYSYPLPNVNAPSAKQVLIYDGHVRQSSVDPATTVTASGFTANATGARVGLTAFEGDFNIAGDRFALNGTNTAEPQTGSTNNFFISATSGSAAPAVANNMSVDAQSLPAPVAVGATSLPLTFSKSGDTFLATGVVVSVPVEDPIVPALAVTPTASPTTVTAAGQTVTYSYLVTNTGNVPLSGIAIDHTAFSGGGGEPVVSCPTGTLTPLTGQTTCTATYPVTQADVDAGAVNATVVATGNTATSTPVTSPPQTISVTATRAPSLSVTGSANPPAISTAGQTVTYTFTVTNTGNVTLPNASVVPTLFTGIGPTPAFTCPTGPAATLAPTAQLTCTASVTVLQNHLDTGGFVLGVYAQASRPGGGVPVTANTAVNVAVAGAPSLTLDKTASPSVASTAGTAITFSFLLTNTGNQTLTGVGVDEEAFFGTGTLGAVTCPAGATSLAPTAAVTCTASYTVTQTDVNNGGISNLAAGTGTAPGGVAVRSASDFAGVSIAAAPSLSLDLTSLPTSPAAAGETITFNYLVTNTGNVPLATVNIVPGTFTGTGSLSAVACPAGAASLAPTATVTCTATYDVTQADVDNGGFGNTAAATGTDLTGAPITSAPDSAAVTAPAAASIALATSVTPTTATQAGDTVTFSYLLTNTGNVTLSTPGVIEDSFTGSTDLTISCPTATLDPTATVTCTAGYTLTQADVNNGGVSSTARATGTPPASAAIYSTPATAGVTVAAAPALVLDKTVTPTTPTAVGDLVTYTFLVTNTGNVTVSDVGIEEGAFTGSGPLSAISCANGAGSLDPSDTVTCTATYTVTQTDVNNGGFTNTATATADDGAVTSGPDSATVTIARIATLSLDQTVAPTTVTGAGQAVTFSFLLTNTGNVSLTGVAVVPGTFTGTGSLTVTCPVDTLEPLGTTTCTAPYTLSQSDIDNGGISTTATAAALSPTDEPVSSGADTATVTAPATPGLELATSVSPQTAAQAGDTVTYTFVLTNTGNVTLADVSVDEVGFSGTGDLSELDCVEDPASLAPTGVLTCTADYTVTQADVDAGIVTNSARSEGTTPGGAQAFSDPDQATVTIAASPSLGLAKSVTPTVADAADEELLYSFVVTNTGNVTVTAVAVGETAFSGTGALTVTCPTMPASLPPGGSLTCTAGYLVTQADVDAGVLTNSAVASAQPPLGARVESGSASAEVSLPAEPALFLLKTVVSAPIEVTGDVVEYAFTVRNDGNVTLTEVGIDESVFTGTGILGEIVCDDAPMAPSDETVCTADYVVTQADVDSGTIDNTATATASPPVGEPITSEASTASVTILAAPALTLAKTASPADNESYVVGQEIVYSFAATNTGNVTLDDITVVEGNFTGSGEISAVTCPDTAGTLPPGGTVTCTADYTITQADVDRQSIVNDATATGTAPSQDPVTSEPSEATLTSIPTPAISLVKTADRETFDAAGQVVQYGFLVTNTGNVTLTDVTVTESSFSGTGDTPEISCPDDSLTLAPGASATCTADYTVTQTDLDNGRLTNTAVVSSTSPVSGGIALLAVDDTTDESTLEILAVQSPALSVVKTADLTAITLPEQAVTYTFLVTNTGNVTLGGIKVDEIAFNGTGGTPVVSCGDDLVLGPGEQLTCTAEYLVTVADLAVGTLTNEAVAVGTGPDGEQWSVLSAGSVVGVPVVAPVDPIDPPVTPPVTPPAPPAPPVAQPTLPVTGVDVPGLTLWAALLLLLGAGAVGLSRRRSTGNRPQG